MGHTTVQLLVVHLKTRADLWEKGSSREKVNVIIPFYFCVISVMFLLVCGSYACDYALELPDLCSNMLSELLQRRYCMTVGDLLDHHDNLSPSQLCHVILV